MKYFYPIYIIMFLSSLFLSCSQDDIITGNKNIEEGIPSKLRIEFNSGFKSRSTGLTNAEEKSINNVQLFVFNSNGILLTTKFYPSVNLTTGINVDTPSGTGMQVYLIANITPISANFVSLYDNVATINDLKALRVFTTGDDIEQDRILLMEGNGIVDVPSSGQACAVLTITLEYVMSKVYVDIIDNTPAGQSVDWSGWKLQNAARTSYILPNTTDAVDINNSSEFLSSATSINFTDSVYDVSGVQKNGKHATFYIFENRRGGRKAGSPTDTDQKNKTEHAPDFATAFIADGSYFENNENKGVRATIYLGKNEYDNYDVERSNIYRYKITVNNFNDIDIDSRVEAVNAGFQAEILQTTLDCHYDWRPIRVGAYDETLTIDVLDFAGNVVTNPQFWLKVSSINLNQFVDDGNGTFIRPIYTPATDMVLSIPGIVTGTSSTKAFKYYYLYADEFNSVGDERKAKIRVSSSAGGMPITFDIIQKGYLTLGSNVGLRYIDNDTNDSIDNTSDFRLAVENTEEATLILTPGVAAGAEQTNTMQFGFPNINIQPSNSLIIDYYKRNGFPIATNMVLNNGVLRPPYGRISTTTISEEIHNPIFNSYAARYCFEKNRDVDGNGKIEGSEIKWYLPSIDELELLFVGNPHLGIPNTAYTSSTQFSTTRLTGARLDLGRSGFATKSVPLYIRCVKKLAPNAQQKSSPYVEPGTEIINCEGFDASLLRAVNPSIPVPTHTEADVLNTSFSKRFKVAYTDVDNTVNWNSVGGQCEGYKQPGETQASKTWRAPTQRELYIMYLLHRELQDSGVPGFTDFIQNGSYYWSSTEYSLDSGQAWGMDFYQGVMYNRTKSTKYYLRCVQDQ